MSEDERGGRLTDPATRRQVLKGAAAVSAALGAGGVLAACGGGGSDKSGAPVTGGGAAAKGTIKKGGNLRIGVQAGSNKETQDAHTANIDPEFARAANLYEPLARYQPDGTFAMVLAESIEPKGADQWIVKLKPDIEFHNGKTLDADDLIFTLKRIADPKLAARGAGTMATIDFKKLKKLDPLTVQIPLKAPNSVFPTEVGQYFNGLVPVGYDPKKPVGTGPFKAGEFTPAQQTTLLRFANYHDPQRPYADQLTIVEFTDAGARVNALLSGQVDAIGALPATQVKTVQATSGMKVLISPTGSYIPVAMHMGKVPFKDVRLRQAMRLIVDRKQLVEQTFSGYGKIGNDLYSPYDPDYASDIPQREQDLEQAKSLLKQAGQPNLSVELSTVPFYDGMVESAQVIGEQAKAAGINVRVKKYDPDPWLANYLKWPFTQGYWGTRDYLPQAAQVMLPGAPLNDTGWQDAEWTKIMLQAKATLDPAKRKELLHAAQVIEHERGTYIIWGFLSLIDAHTAKVGGAVGGKIGSFGDFALANMGFVA